MNEVSYYFLLSLTFIISGLAVWWMFGKLSWLMLEDAHRAGKLIGMLHYDSDGGWERENLIIMTRVFGPLFILILAMMVVANGVRKYSIIVIDFILGVIITFANSIKSEYSKIKHEKETRWDK